MGERRLLIIPGDDKTLEIFFPQEKNVAPSAKNRPRSVCRFEYFRRGK